MDKYFDLILQTHTRSDAELVKIIGNLTVSVEVYSKSFENIKGTNIEIIRLIPSHQLDQPPGQSKQLLKFPCLSDSNSIMI